MKGCLTDFVFVTEVKNRELENILLLKYELEKRGYSVCLVETWDQVFCFAEPIKAKVLITFALYNDDTLKFMMSFVDSCNKVVNLQWEQIFTNSDEKLDEFTGKNSVGVAGSAKNALHVAWGDNTVNRLVNRYGMSRENIILTGHIALDFLRPEFKSYYFSKDNIMKKYSINSNSKLYLFISSFSYVGLPEQLINSELYQNQGFDVNNFQLISRQSQSTILKWFEYEVKKYPNIVLIYRPHPAEQNNEILNKLERKYPNFKVISDYSVKQWILVADKIYSWWSTSVAEIYAAHKGCDILRPVKIDYDSELEIYNEASMIDNFEYFDSHYLDDNKFPIPNSVMKHFYYIDEKTPTYILISNHLESILMSDKPSLSAVQLAEISNSHINYSRTQKIIIRIKLAAKKALFLNPLVVRVIKSKWGDKMKFHNRTLRTIMDEFLYNYSMYLKNHHSKKEIDAIYARIKEMIEK